MGELNFINGIEYFLNQSRRILKVDNAIDKTFFHVLKEYMSLSLITIHPLSNLNIEKGYEFNSYLL